MTEIDYKTPIFYGDLVEAAMSKDIKRMVELIDTFDSKQIVLLTCALTRITGMSLAIVQVRENGE